MESAAFAQLDELRASGLALPFEVIDTAAAASGLMDGFAAVLLDCDGVLYRGGELTPHAAAFVRRLCSSKLVLFVTNASSRSRSQLRARLSAKLECTLRDEQMVPSSYACACFLRQALAPRTRIFVVGGSGLCDEIRIAGFSVEQCDDDDSGMTEAQFAVYDAGAQPFDAVVVGHDTHFNYRKLCIATLHLQRNSACLFVSTNDDAFDIVGADGRHWPGNGALVRAVEFASQRAAVNVGKPSAALANLILSEHAIAPESAIMIGDRLDTDIQFGVGGGMATALVLTGCTSARDLIALLEQDHGQRLPIPFPRVVMPYLGLMCA